MKLNWSMTRFIYKFSIVPRTPESISWRCFSGQSTAKNVMWVVQCPGPSQIVRHQRDRQAPSVGGRQQTWSTCKMPKTILHLLTTHWWRLVCYTTHKNEKNRMNHWNNVNKLKLITGWFRLLTSGDSSMKHRLTSIQFAVSSMQHKIHEISN